jgi:hypothetical protein
VVDTRFAAGPLGSPSLVPGTRDFPLLSGTCGIPDTAVAYSLNVIAVPKTNLSYLMIYATGQDKPQTSTLNATMGEPVANSVVVTAGTEGSVRAFATDETDLILDVDGYFVPAIAGSQGPQGVPGPQGPQGVQGVQGPAGTAGTNGTNGTTGPVVYAASASGIPSFSSYASLTGLNQTPAGTADSTQVAAGSSCASVSITLTRTGAGSDDLSVKLQKNGADTYGVGVNGNGTATTPFPLTVAPGDLLSLHFSALFTPASGKAYVTVACHPST